MDLSRSFPLPPIRDPDPRVPDVQPKLFDQLPPPGRVVRMVLEYFVQALFRMADLHPVRSLFVPLVHGLLRRNRISFSRIGIETLRA